MALQHLYHVVHDTERERLGAVQNAATWTRSSECLQPYCTRLSGKRSAFERQDQRAARQIDPGGSRPLNAIDRSLHHCRLGQVFLSEGHWMSGD
jgi:hypothetical protein